jgi:2'-5' RNA ligase
VLDAFVSWQARSLPDSVRVVPRDHLHVTLAFLGHRPASELPAIVEALRAAAAPPRDYRLRIGRYRETRSVAMVVLDDVGGGATELAGDVQSRLESAGLFRREGRPWLPHVTVARFREQPRLRLEPPTLRTDVLIPSDAAAYLSRPGRAAAGGSGVRYDVLHPVALGGYEGG